MRLVSYRFRNSSEVGVVVGGSGLASLSKRAPSLPRSLRGILEAGDEALSRAREISAMTFKIEFLIHYLSTVHELQPGDVISTGTPGGVGSRRKPPRFLKAGDIVEVEISGVGLLSNPVVDEI